MGRKKLRDKKVSIFPVITRVLEEVSHKTYEYLKLVGINYAIYGFCVLKIASEGEKGALMISELYASVLSITCTVYLIITCTKDIFAMEENMFLKEKVIWRFPIVGIFLFLNLWNGTPNVFQAWSTRASVLFLVVKICRIVMGLIERKKKSERVNVDT